MRRLLLILAFVLVLSSASARADDASATVNGQTYTGTWGTGSGTDVCYKIPPIAGYFPDGPSDPVMGGKLTNQNYWFQGAIAQGGSATVTDNLGNVAPSVGGPACQFRTNSPCAASGQYCYMAVAVTLAAAPAPTGCAALAGGSDPYWYGKATSSPSSSLFCADMKYQGQAGLFCQVRPSCSQPNAVSWIIVGDNLTACITSQTCLQPDPSVPACDSAGNCDGSTNPTDPTNPGTGGTGGTGGAGCSASVSWQGGSASFNCGLTAAQEAVLRSIDDKVTKVGNIDTTLSGIANRQMGEVQVQGQQLAAAKETNDEIRSLHGEVMGLRQQLFTNINSEQPVSGTGAVAYSKGADTFRAVWDRQSARARTSVIFQFLGSFELATADFQPRWSMDLGAYGRHQIDISDWVISLVRAAFVVLTGVHVRRLFFGG